MYIAYYWKPYKRMNILFVHIKNAHIMIIVVNDCLRMIVLRMIHSLFRTRRTR